MKAIRVASGEPLVTGVAMATDCGSEAGRRAADPRRDGWRPVDIAVAACGRAGTTGISCEIAKQMGV
ncbi:hypothetical protein GCM10023170_062730 [Phytohabitans houttuyneae]|uniref:Uncharacterized protein n=1 Tax=Phytohabitans houttuyneae TaxID=1076126 RepID=A0A6V8KCL3_9ACTN|nr:hypothetical protein Phou_043180 [Phytohabitans houttuyneae]